MRALAIAMVCVSLAAAQSAQSDDESTAPSRYQYFSGVVQSIHPDRFTVQRSLAGQETVTRIFHVTRETRIEGTIRTRARVTVRFIIGEDGNRALYVLVRTDSPGK